MTIDKFRKLKDKNVILLVIFILCLLLLLLIGYKNRVKKSSEYIVSDDERVSPEYENQDIQMEDKDESTPSPEKPENIIANDFEYAKYREGIYREYPWYREIPIETDDYFLTWVLQEKSFRIYLKISESKSTKEQKDQLIDQALEDIQELTGEPYKNFPYYILYTEE